ncbi:MAG: site-specific integrase, partial [Paracoccaceae bacterium]|nr:site-specific integrase [Paracoccaceae bacterium]
MTPLAPHLSAFLQKHLPNERGASRHTIAAYAHAFTLLLRFTAARLKRQPSDLAIEELDVGLIRAFLEHIEEGRANSARSRNARLAAIKAFFRFLE